MTRGFTWARFALLSAASAALHCGGEETSSLPASGGGSASSRAGESGSGATAVAGFGGVLSNGASPTSLAGQAGAGGASSTSTSGGGAGGASSGGSASGSSTGGSASDCAGSLLCEDFESYAVGSPPSGRWSITKNGSGTSLVVDALRARSGAKSGHFSGSLTGSNSVHMSTTGAPAFPVAGKQLFVRFSMFVQTYPGSKNEEMHTRLVWIGADDMVLSTSGAGIAANDGRGYAMETYNGIGVERLSSGHYRDTSLRMPQAPHVAKWVCWELELDNGGGPPAGVQGGAITRLWRDGTELELTVKGGESETWGPVPLEMLNFSLFAYQTASEPADFWIDDIAVGTQRIGCPSY